VFTILVLAPGDADLAALGSRHPSVEILGAHDVEDALEKLARNRRIDAVLLLNADAGAAAEILEEDPGAPPLFAPGISAAIPGLRSLGPGRPAELVERLVGVLAAES